MPEPEPEKRKPLRRSKSVSHFSRHPRPRKRKGLKKSATLNRLPVGGGNGKDGKGNSGKSDSNNAKSESNSNSKSESYSKSDGEEESEGESEEEDEDEEDDRMSPGKGISSMLQLSSGPQSSEKQKNEDPMSMLQLSKRVPKFTNEKSNEKILSKQTCPKDQGSSDSLESDSLESDSLERLYRLQKFLLESFASGPSRSSGRSSGEKNQTMDTKTSKYSKEKLQKDELLHKDIELLIVEESERVLKNVKRGEYLQKKLRHWAMCILIYQREITMEVAKLELAKISGKLFSESESSDSESSAVNSQQFASSQQFAKNILKMDHSPDNSNSETSDSDTESQQNANSSDADSSQQNYNARSEQQNAGSEQHDDFKQKSKLQTLDQLNFGSNVSLPVVDLKLNRATQSVSDVRETPDSKHAGVKNKSNPNRVILDIMRATQDISYFDKFVLPAESVKPSRLAKKTAAIILDAINELDFLFFENLENLEGGEPESREFESMIENAFESMTLTCLNCYSKSSCNYSESKEQQFSLFEAEFGTKNLLLKLWSNPAGYGRTPYTRNSGSQSSPLNKTKSVSFKNLSELSNSSHCTSNNSSTNSILLSEVASKEFASKESDKGVSSQQQQLGDLLWPPLTGKRDYHRCNVWTCCGTVFTSDNYEKLMEAVSLYLKTHTEYCKPNSLYYKFNICFEETKSFLRKGNFSEKQNSVNGEKQNSEKGSWEPFNTLAELSHESQVSSPLKNSQLSERSPKNSSPIRISSSPPVLITQSMTTQSSNRAGRNYTDHSHASSHGSSRKSQASSRKSQASSRKYYGFHSGFHNGKNSASRAGEKARNTKFGNMSRFVGMSSLDMKDICQSQHRLSLLGFFVTSILFLIAAVMAFPSYFEPVFPSFLEPFELTSYLVPSPAVSSSDSDVLQGLQAHNQCHIDH